MGLGGQSSVNGTLALRPATEVSLTERSQVSLVRVVAPFYDGPYGLGRQCPLAEKPSKGEAVASLLLAGISCVLGPIRVLTIRRHIPLFRADCSGAECRVVLGGRGVRDGIIFAGWVLLRFVSTASARRPLFAYLR